MSGENLYKLEEDIVIEENEEFINYGIINGNVTVCEGGVFKEYGILNGNIFGTGIVEIRGMIHGKIADTCAVKHTSDAKK